MRARKRTVPPPPAKVQPKRGIAAGLALLVILGLIGQAGWVFYRNRQAQVTLHFERAMAPRGPGKGQVTGCRHMAADGKSVYYLQGVGADSVLQKFALDGQWQGWVGPQTPAKERLDNGFAVAAAADGTVWVVERGGALKQFSGALRLMRSVPLPGCDATGVAVAPDGSVWVADHSGRLLVLAPGSDQTRPFTGEKKGRLRAPFRLCFDPQGGMYVLDLELGPGLDPVVKSYDAQGAFRRVWPVKDQPANEFACIAWHPAGYVVLNDPRAEVVDAKGFRLYSPDGTLRALAALTDNGMNLRAIPGFCISPTGDWFMDLTPLQQGFGRLTWAPALQR